MQVGSGKNLPWFASEMKYRRKFVNEKKAKSKENGVNLKKQN